MRIYRGLMVASGLSVVISGVASLGMDPTSAIEGDLVTRAHSDTQATLGTSVNSSGYWAMPC